MRSARDPDSRRTSRILIVALNYSPEHTGIAPYTTALAEHLSATYQVTVLTTHPHYPAWKRDPSFTGWTKVTMEDGVRVIRLRHYVPSSPRLLRRLVSEITFALRVCLCKLGKLDAVIAVTPGLIPSAAALLRARVARVPVGVIVQDLYNRAAVEVRDTRRTGLATAVLKLESAILRRADAIVTIHDLMAQSISARLRVPPELITTIRNWTHVGKPALSRSETRDKMGWKNELVVLHAGNMGAKQDLSSFVALTDALVREQKDLLFVLMGNGSERAILDSLARDRPHVEVIDSVPAEDFMEVLHAADVLLLHEKEGIHEMCVPSKLSSYFAAGRPVLGISNVASAAFHEIHVAGAGISVTSREPATIGAAIIELASGRHAIDFSISGPAFAEANYSAEVSLQDYERWLATLMRKRAVQTT